MLESAREREGGREILKGSGEEKRRGDADVWGCEEDAHKVEGHGIGGWLAEGWGGGRRGGARPWTWNGVDVCRVLDAVWRDVRRVLRDQRGDWEA